jgi:predicted nucleic acid-binding protein
LKVFIDVNIFIDVMTKRRGWTESLRVLNLARRFQEIGSWTSAQTLPLIYFFRRRVVDETTARADAQAILKGLQLVPLSQAVLDQAIISASPDFEDNIQLVSAVSISANHLITRNKKDFDASTMSVLNPEEWLALQEIAIIEAKLTPLPARDDWQSLLDLFI